MVIRQRAREIITDSEYAVRVQFQLYATVTEAPSETLMRLHDAVARTDSQDLTTFIDEHLVRNSSNLVDLFNRKDPNKGVRALHVAVNAKSLENVEILIAHGADVRLTNKDGFVPAHLAFVMKNKPMLELIMRQSIRNPADRHGFTHLHAAALLNDPSLIRKYMHIGGDINTRMYVTQMSQKVQSQYKRPRSEQDMLCIWPVRTRNHWNEMEEDPPRTHERTFGGYTPLHLAVEHENLETLQAILEQPHLDINIRDARGFSALHLACALSDEKFATVIAKMLLIKGADVAARTLSGATPLHVATYKGHDSLIVLLFSYGAKADVWEDWDNVTPLHLAARNLMADTVHVLLVAGADAQRKDKKKRTALHWLMARDWCYDANTSIEIKKNKEVSCMLYDTAIQWLLAGECDINAQDLWGRTAMHMAIKYHNACAAQRLQLWEPDLEIYDWKYNTVKDYDKWKTVWCTTCLSIHPALSVKADNEEADSLD